MGRHDEFLAVSEPDICVDGAPELFGSPTQDGKIDAADAEFGKLRVWIDADGDGVSDAVELKTLAEVGIESISLTTTAAPGTKAGNDRGFATGFTRASGTTGAAETVHFQTDRRDTVDNTPSFTPAEGVDKLPLLAEPGNIPAIESRRMEGAFAVAQRV